MMTTTYAHHPGGIHPAMPHGQAIGPGPGPNPGQPMGQPMQMHPGVSGPNGAHVTQAGPMMGMQPGVGGPMQGQPSAHAMAHLGPQAQLYQQHQMQQAMATNPALANLSAQQRHQQYLRQQQQLVHQQQQQNAMMFQNGMNPAISGAPQMQGMMAGNPQMVPSIPPHMRQQLAQQQQMHQQQQAAAQAAQAAQQAHHQQQQQLQQHLAMQHASSQQSNQGQQGQPTSSGPGPGPGPQATQQGPIRPPSQMGGAYQPQASPAPQANTQQTEQPQQAAQPTPAQNQPPNGPQQTAQPSQPQQGQQGQQQPQPGQQNPQQGQQQSQAMTNINVQQMALLRQRHQAQAQVAAQAAQAQAQNRMKGATILQLMQFADHLSRFLCPAQNQDKVNTLTHWQGFVQRFFADDGSFKQMVKDISDPSSKPKQFEICYTALPRYYWTQYASGVENIQVTLDGAFEKDLSGNGHIVECGRAKFIYWFRSGTQLVCTGRLIAVFSQADKMDTLSFETQDHQQYLPRASIERLFSQDSPNQKQSPRINKTNPRQRNQPRNQPAADPMITPSDLPEPPVGGWGITNRILSYLETGETISYMQDLIVHYHSNPGMTSSEALSNLISTYPQQYGSQQIQQAQQMNMAQQTTALIQQQQQNLPPGARTPSGLGSANAAGGQPQFMSPHITNLGLPSAMNGSPHLSMQTHTPSPAQAHNLIPTHSQQGTNSSAASATTSPNVSNKRRRPSAVKVEADDGSGEVNGGSGAQQKVKQSPRVGGQNKRVKPNAS